MEKKSYAILDIAKFISALFVIAIHCAPLIQISEPLNFAFVQILARLAVPFFFITSGFLFFRGIRPQDGRSDAHNLQALKHYWFRILKIYAIWSVLYLPLIAYSWLKGGFDASSLVRFVRDVLFTGTSYHLWFLPALLLGIPIVYWLYTSMKKRSMLCIVLILYVFGVAINVYGNVLLDVPGIGRFVTLYESVLVTTRNGFFFAPIFLTLGIYATDFVSKAYKKETGIAFLISAVALCLEAYWLRSVGIMHDLTSMYIMLVPCIFFLFLFLMQWNLKPHGIYKKMRKMSLLIYVSHIYFIFLFLNILQWNNLLVYIISVGCSCVFAYAVLYLSKKLPWLHNLY